MNNYLYRKKDKYVEVSIMKGRLLNNFGIAMTSHYFLFFKAKRYRQRRKWSLMIFYLGFAKKLQLLKELGIWSGSFKNKEVKFALFSNSGRRQIFPSVWWSNFDFRILSNQRKSDGKSLSQAFDNQMQSEEKLDLIRLALAKYRWLIIWGF